LNYKYTFTVFTTTFNRAYVLHRVYNSLKPQTFRDFEWLIVDNGSSDNTQELVKKWIQEADFPIRLISLKNNVGYNGGWNRGVSEAQGKFFLSLDSDDTCTENTLEGFKKYWDLIPNDSKESFTGVTSLCADQHGNLVNSGKFPKDITDSDSLEMRYKYKVLGEMWGFNKTNVLKQFPLPESTEVIPVGIIFSKIGRLYKTRFINQIYRTYYINEPDRNDQETYLSIKSRTTGGIVYYLDILNNDTPWFRHSPFNFFRSAIIYSRFSLHKGVGFLDQMKKLNNGFAKTLLALMFPAGVLVFLKEKITGISKRKDHTQ
jgi:glycosyltransferase involved in cell wall biosynthesis